MEIGLAEGKSALLDMEEGTRFHVGIIIPNPDAVHGGFSSAGEDPFIGGFEEIGTNHE